MAIARRPGDTTSGSTYSQCLVSSSFYSRWVLGDNRQLAQLCAPDDLYFGGYSTALGSQQAMQIVHARDWLPCEAHDDVAFAQPGRSPKGLVLQFSG